jgi:hypothetical protein
LRAFSWGIHKSPFHFYDFLMNRAKVIEFRLFFQNLASSSKTNMNSLETA